MEDVLNGFAGKNGSPQMINAKEYSQNIEAKINLKTN